MSNIKVITGNKNRDSFIAAIGQLHRNKPKKKRLLKALEELSELQTAILQHVNKGSSEECILEETIDVFVNIELILLNWTPEEIRKMYEAKSAKFFKSKDLIKYKDVVLV